GRALMSLAVVAAAAQMVNQANPFLRPIGADSFLLQASARFLSSILARPFLFRVSLLVICGIAISLSGSAYARFVAFPLALAAEFVGRYLFYVSVVPKNIAAPYLSSQEQAA